MTLTEIIANPIGNDEFVPGKSSNEMFFGTNTDARLTDVIAAVAEAIIGISPVEYSNTDYAPAYSYGTEDLTAGTTPLETGKLHFVYE